MVVSAKFGAPRVEIFTEVVPTIFAVGRPTVVGIIGVSKTGPVLKPTLITSQTEFVNRFGGFILNALVEDPALQFKQSYGSLLALRVLASGGQIVFTRISDGTESKSSVKVNLQPVPANIIGERNIVRGVDSRQRNLLHIKYTKGNTIQDKQVVFAKKFNLSFNEIISGINSAFAPEVIAFKDITKTRLMLKGEDGLSSKLIVDEEDNTVGGATQSWTLNNNRVIPESFTFTITSGVNIIRGKDNGNGGIVDNGSTGNIYVVSGTIDYITGAVNVTLSGSIAANLKIKSSYTKGEIDTTSASATQSWNLTFGSVVPNSFSFYINLGGGNIVRGRDNGNGNIVDDGSVGTTTVVSGTINYNTGAVFVTLSAAINAGLLIISSYEFNVKLELLGASDPNADLANIIFGFGTKVSETIHITGRETIFEAIDPGSAVNNSVINVFASTSQDFAVKIQILNPAGALVEEFDNITIDNIQSELDNSKFFRVKTSTQIGLPQIGTYFTSGGSDGIDNLTKDNWLAGINAMFDSPLLSKIDIVCVPGVWDPEFLLNIYAQASEKNFFVVIDPPSTLTLSEVIDFRHGRLVGFNDLFAIQGSHVAMYFPWIRKSFAAIGKVIVQPPSIEAVLAMIKADHSVGPWDAPFGRRKGLISDAISTTVDVSIEAAASLQTFPNFINPIVHFPDTGFVIWGQRTLETSVNVLTTGINVVRDKIFVTKQLKPILEEFLSETITDELLTRVNLAVSTFLRNLQGQGGVIDFSVKVAEVTTPEDIANNVFRVEVKFQPPTAAELIVLNFVITSNVGVEIA